MCCSRTAARILIDGRPFGKGTRFEQFLAADGGARFPIRAAAMQAPLPNKAQVRLVWGKGIVSESGVPSSQDQVLAYEVRDTFQARFTCDRVNKDAQCLAYPADGDWRSPRRCRVLPRKKS